MTRRRDDSPAPRGDEAGIYEAYAERLRSSIRHAVNTSPENIDDACAFAWMQLLRRQPERGTVYGWLWKVARNEALKLALGQQRVEPREGIGEDVIAPGDVASGVERLLDAKERLRRLPERERKAVVLQSVGLSYTEAAEQLGISRARLNGLLVQAQRRLNRGPHVDQRLWRRDLTDHRPRSESQMTLEPPKAREPHPRSLLLAELQRNPPPFLRSVIGNAPGEYASRMPRRLEWSRLALAIVDYRLAHGISDPAHAFGPEPGDDDPARRTLTQDIARFDRGRDVRPKRGLAR